MKKIYILLFCLFISLVFIFNYKPNNTYSNLNDTKYIENKDTYEAIDGIHTIYWAQGVKAPKMTLDPNLIGKKGYFNLEKYEDYETYMAEFEPNHGYYDYNKNFNKRPDEHPLCYLGSASNLISWWLEQNKSYINLYTKRLKETDIYGSIDGLRKMYPYNEKDWKELLEYPPFETDNGYKAQELGLSALVTKHLNPYYYKTNDGYYADLVLDFFFNGYEALTDENVPIQNSEDNFIKDPRGGYFHPLIGKTRMVEKLKGGNYTTFNYIETNLRRMFASGKGVSFSYIANAKRNHAITVWGAEYDSNGKLVRIFITDTDDIQPSKTGDTYLRGLVGVNTVSDINGKLALTNRKTINPNNPGNYINAITTLSLSQDLLETRLNDTTNPIKPTIIKQPKDTILALNAKVNFKVEIKKNDEGYIEYEWYESNTKDGKGIKIAKGNNLNINANKLGTKYYYCIIKNIKNGKEINIETDHFKIETKDIELVNAMIPNVTFNYNTLTLNQYEQRAIRVDAKVTDGGILSYQWYQSHDNSSTNGTKLEGEINNIFYPPTNNVTNGLYYYCVVTNTNQNVTGNKISVYKTPFSKRIKVIKNDNPLDPIVTLKPNNLYINQNEKATLEVQAKSLDEGIIKYQWYEIVNNDLKILENENNSILKINTANKGIKKYKCKIINIKNNKEKFIFTDEIIVTISEVKLDLTIDELKTNNAVLYPSFNKDIKEYKATIPHNIDKLDLNVKSNYKIDIVNPNLNIGETKDVIITISYNDNFNIYKIKVTRDSNHQYNKWEKVKEPTCIDKGQEKHTCIVCGHTEYRDINPLGHEFEKGWTYDKRPTLNETGIKSHHCKRCNERKDITIVDKIKEEIHNHKFTEWEVINEPTCIDKGKYKRTCSICGFTEYKDIDALGHEFLEEWTIDKQPTDNEPGIKSHHCKRCDYKKDETPIEPLEKHTEHIYSKWEVIKQPTKKEPGLERRTCSICGNIEEREIPKIENKINIIIPISVIIFIIIGLIIKKKNIL